MLTLSEIEFRDPLLLWTALLALPVFWLSWKIPGRFGFSSLRLLPHAKTSWRVRYASIPHILLAAAVLSLAVAAAGPRTLKEEIRKEQAEESFESIAIMMVVDTSSSMGALDLSTETREQTRLDVVRGVFRDFVRGNGAGLKGRPEDSIGLIGFAKHADSLSPMTLDHENLLRRARKLELVVANSDEDGTAIGDALGLAVERLRNTPIKSKVIILLSDGADNASEDPYQEAAALARKLGFKVYTIGAGSEDGGRVRVKIRLPDGSYEPSQMRNNLDESTLRDIAEKTEGQYFRATDATGLRAIYQEIDRLERFKIEETSLIELHEDDFDEHFDLFALLALIAGMGGHLLAGTIFLRLP